MLHNIYIVTWNNGYFGSAAQTWLSINVEELSNKLSSPSNEVKIITYKDLLEIKLKEDDLVIYCSSEDYSMRTYLKDVMYLIDKKCRIIPSYEALLAHENKGFQQLIRKEKQFGNLDGCYSFDFDELKRNKPYVYKKVTGAGSSGVQLVNTDKIENKIKRNVFNVGIKRKIIKKQRWLKLSNKEYELYNYRHKGFALSVTQDFIKDLTCDYKVLVFGDKFFVLRRDVRKNDFRASGSGIFKFDEVPFEVLSFAKDVFEILKEPYASLDIAVSKNETHLIEYQILNFGPYTLNNSPGYYTYNKGWVYHEGRSDLNDCFSDALLQHIEKMAL